jgi:hypothetical protein
MLLNVTGRTSGSGSPPRPSEIGLRELSACRFRIRAPFAPARNAVFSMFRLALVCPRLPLHEFQTTTETPSEAGLHFPPRGTRRFRFASLWCCPTKIHIKAIKGAIGVCNKLHFAAAVADAVAAFVAVAVLLLLTLAACCCVHRDTTMAVAGLLAGPRHKLNGPSGGVLACRSCLDEGCDDSKFEFSFWRTPPEGPRIAALIRFVAAIVARHCGPASPYPEPTGHEFQTAPERLRRWFPTQSET